MFILALQITNIEKQQKIKNRYSIFLNEEYRFSVAAEILMQRNLIIGQSLTETEIEAIKRDDEKQRSKIQAFKILVRRDHSEKELETKLKQKGFSPNIIKLLLTELKQKHFLNDENFADLFARNRLIQHPVGKRRLALELKRKGISESLTDRTIEKIYTEFDEYELAKKVAEKKVRSLKNQPLKKIKQKLGDFLIGRGFDWEIIQHVFNGLNYDDEEVNLIF